MYNVVFIRRFDMSGNAVCPYCKTSVVANSNFCFNCGKPLSATGRKRAEDGLVDLVQVITSLVQGTGKLVSALGETVENRAAESTISKDVDKVLDKVLASLGKAVKDVGEAADRLSKEAADKAEKGIRKQK